MSVVRELAHTPDRPESPLQPPGDRLDLHVEIDESHLANPHLAVARLLASEAGAFARVTGDDRQLDVCVALPDPSPGCRVHAEAWARWAIHNAGIRGTIDVVTAVSQAHQPGAGDQTVQRCPERTSPT